MRWLVSVSLLAFAVATPAQAQWWAPSYHSSTVGESYARGMADLVRSQGVNNLRNSEAAKNYEQARSAYLDNRLKATDTYFQMRQKNRAYRAAERGPRPTSEQLFRIAHAKAPDRLSPSELDPITGDVGWPSVLRGEEFNDDREKLEKMFAYWARNQKQLTATQYADVQAAVNAMTEKLKLLVNDVPANTYLAGRNFLQSLIYELQVAQG